MQHMLSHTCCILLAVRHQHEPTTTTPCCHAWRCVTPECALVNVCSCVYFGMHSSTSPVYLSLSPTVCLDAQHTTENITYCAPNSTHRSNVSARIMWEEKYEVEYNVELVGGMRGPTSIIHSANDSGHPIELSMLSYVSIQFNGYVR